MTLQHLPEFKTKIVYTDSVLGDVFMAHARLLARKAMIKREAEGKPAFDVLEIYQQTDAEGDIELGYKGYVSRLTCVACDGERVADLTEQVIEIATVDAEYAAERRATTDINQ